MTAKRPGPSVLEGRFIRLEPLTEAVLPELGAAICTPAVFANGYGGGPQGYVAAAADFPKWGRGYYMWETGNPFLVRAPGGPLDGVALGWHLARQCRVLHSDRRVAGCSCGLQRRLAEWGDQPVEYRDR